MTYRVFFFFTKTVQVLSTVESEWLTTKKTNKKSLWNTIGNNNRIYGVPFEKLFEIHLLRYRKTFLTWAYVYYYVVFTLLHMACPTQEVVRSFFTSGSRIDRITHVLDLLLSTKNKLFLDRAPHEYITIGRAPRNFEDSLSATTPIFPLASAHALIYSSRARLVLEEADHFARSRLRIVR